MNILHCFTVATLVFAGFFLFCSAMVLNDIGYPFFGSNNVILIAIVLWLVVFFGLAWRFCRRKEAPGGEK